ncbi:PadR family transcriptional regulator [Micromonospora zamorensis]|uniref:PadR family transcriptional regulator n=1 Tax=Micromonospora zamorensis TaxID=709883 RepID=A0ABZ1PQV6_9ACTN
MEGLKRVTQPTLDVLTVLLSAEEDLHGFGVAKQTGRAPGTVYPILRKLEDGGYLEGRWEQEAPAEGRPRRRYYRLTVAGRAEATELLHARASAVPHLRPQLGESFAWGIE